MFNDFDTMIGIIGAIVGLFGIVLSIYFYFKSKKTKKLIINSESTVLISENLSKYENLKISYNDENINSLTSTVIKIKNIGTDYIVPEDLAPSSPITIITTKKFLLNDVSQYDISKSNPKSIIGLSKIDDSTIKVVFDFLSSKDYIIIKLLHTGEISVDWALKNNPNKKYKQKNFENNTISNEEATELITSSKLLLNVLCPFILGISLLVDAFKSEISVERLFFYFILYLLLEKMNQKL